MDNDVNDSTQAPTRIPVQVKNPARHSARRQVLFFSCVVVITSLAVWLMADILWRGGLTGIEAAILALFVPLFGMVALGFTQAVFGFVTLLLRRDTYEIAVTWLPGEPGHRQAARGRCADSIYNEDVSACTWGCAPCIWRWSGGSAIDRSTSLS
jgi:membrane glycosyltransferase